MTNCPGSVATGVRNIDRLLQADDPQYNSDLSRLLLPHLEPGAHPQRLLLTGDDSEKEIGSRLPPLSKWGPQMQLPAGTCVLSSTYKWPFDVRDSKESVNWAFRRLLESAKVKSLDPAGAFARFPIVRGPEFESWSGSTKFGPFNHLGLVLNLRTCETLSPEVARITVARRAKWLEYILRECGPLPVMHFPPLTQVLSTMVTHEEFTDEVAMDVYGVYDNCTIDVMMEGGLMPVFGVTPSSECTALAKISNGTLTLTSLNGATVLFLGCLLLQAEDAVQKLLDMRTTGMVILRDMANHGLGWMMPSQDATTIISRWTRSTAYRPTALPPAPRLSLFLSAWMSRKGGPLDGGRRNTPARLFKNAIKLDPLPRLRDSGQQDEDEQTNSEEVSRAIQVSNGSFNGCAAGTAVALFLDVADCTRGAGSLTPSSDVRARRWVEDLIKNAKQLGGSKLIEPEAAESAKTYLLDKLHWCKQIAVGELEQLDKEIRQQVDAYKETVSAPNLKTFLHQFYRAFFVSVTQGRVQDDGVNPLTWRAESLRAEISEARRLLLGLPNTPAPMPAILPPVDTPNPEVDPPTPSPFKSPRYWAVAMVCGIGLALLWSSISISLQAPPGGAAPQDKEAPVGLGRMLTSFQATPDLVVQEGEDVYILSDEVGDWYKIESLDGQAGVSPRRSTA